MGQGLCASSIKFNLNQTTVRGKNMMDREQVLDINRLIDIGWWVEKDSQKRAPISLIYGWPMIFYGRKRLGMEQTSACCIDQMLGVLATGFWLSVELELKRKSWYMEGT